MSLKNTILLDLTVGNDINLYRFELLETGKIIITHKFTKEMDFVLFELEGFWSGTLYELEQHIFKLYRSWDVTDYGGMFDYLDIGLKDRE